MTTEVHLNLNELVDRIALPNTDPRQLQLVLDLILIALEPTTEAIKKKKKIKKKLETIAPDLLAATKSNAL